MSQEIISEIKNHTGIITLKTEDGLNAVNRRMLAEIAEAATAMDMNDEVKAIIIRGGEKAFSAGVDVNEFVADVNPSVLEEMYENFEKIADVKKPVIAAVSGYALGIGFEMALACDIVFASESACFGHPDLSLGTVPGFGATQRLPNTVGKSKTMERIAALPDLAVNTSKELIKTAVSNTNLEEGLEIEKQVYKSSIASDEFRQNLANLAKK